MARIVSEVLQRPVRYQQVSGKAYKATLIRNGMSEAWAQGMVDIAAAANDQDTVTPGPADTKPTAPTRFRQWCEDVLRPAVLA